MPDSNQQTFEDMMEDYKDEEGGGEDSPSFTGIQKPTYYEKLFQNNFPAQDPREKQKPATKEILKAFDDDKDVVLLDAPPGLGKSLVLHATNKAISGRSKDRQSYYVTPLNTLVDQLEEDEFIGNEILSIKGKSNYECTNSNVRTGTTVDKAPCQDNPQFNCPVRDECPYYSLKDRALDFPHVVTNMSFLMADSMIPSNADAKFDDRCILVVDECQNIERFAENFVAFTISENSLPERIWSQIRVPGEDMEDNLGYLKNWIEDEVLGPVEERVDKLKLYEDRSEEQTAELKKLKKFSTRANNFLNDSENNEWVADIESSGGIMSAGDGKVTFKPIHVGRFLDNLLWSRADKIVLSSATIPKGNWLEEVGLADKDIKHIEAGSVFPIENRPIVTDEAVGKMTYNEKDETFPKLAEKIKQIADYHQGQNGFIHCRSYNLQERFERYYKRNHKSWFEKNCFLQERRDRTGSLEKWKGSDKQLFFSVNMAEGISLDGDTCRFQILAKVLYPNTQDKRTDYRLNEMSDWTWYNLQAVIQLEQAYGRAVRSKDDKAVFYLLDESANTLINRNKNLFHDWFLEAITDGGMQRLEE